MWLLVLEIGLIAAAWKRGWKLLSLVPVTLTLVIALSLWAFVASAGLPLKLLALTLLGDVSAVIALAMMCTSPSVNAGQA